MGSNFEALIENLISLPAENECVEFKANYSKPEQEGRDISALANSAAYHGARFAYKVWGIEDSTHEIVGTTFDPAKKKRGNEPLEMWLRQNLSDNAIFEFHRILFREKNLVILKVWPAVHHPIEFQNVSYIRKGSHTQKIRSGSGIENELWNRLQNTGFESQVALEGLTIEEAFDLLEQDDYFNALGLPKPTSLESTLHYFEKDGLAFLQDDGNVSITNLGALLFAQNMDDFPTIKRKKLRISRYDGKGRSAPRYEREFTEGYATAFLAAYNYLANITELPDEMVGARREQRSAYSEVAIRELIANALIHQDLTVRGAGPMVEVFTDRIEVTNPGSPLIQVERLVNDPPRSRNEELSSIMRRLDFCEESGTGWDKVIEGCEAYQAPAPKIEIQNGDTESMRVVLFQPRSFKDLTPEERLDACYWHACIMYANRDYVSNSSLRERFGIENSNAAQISRLIKEALARNLIKPVDPDASPKFRRYQPYWA